MDRRATIYALRFDTSGNKVYDPQLIQTNMARLGFRWSMAQLGTSRIEMVLRCSGRDEAYERYRDHLGHYIMFYENNTRRVTGGWVYQVEMLPHNQVLYVMKGSKDYLDGEYVREVFFYNDDMNTALDDILTVANAYDGNFSTNTDYIATNGADLGGWNADSPFGSKVGEAILQIATLSDTNSDEYDVFFVQDKLDDLDPDKVGVPDYKLVYQKRDATANEDYLPVWLVKAAEMKDVRLSRDINDLTTNARVYYGTFHTTHDGPDRGDDYTGTHDDTGNSTTVARDLTFNFKRLGVRRGDRIDNTTDGSHGFVDSLSTDGGGSEDNDTITLKDPLTGGSNNYFANGDSFTIYTRSKVVVSDGSGSNIQLNCQSVPAVPVSTPAFGTSGILPDSIIENIDDGSRSQQVRVVDSNSLRVQPPEGGTNDDYSVNGEFVVIYMPPAFMSPDLDTTSMGIQAGDEVTNVTDGSRGSVVNMYGPWVALSDLEGGTKNRIANGDSITFKTKWPVKFVTASATPSYFDVEKVWYFPEFDEDAAQRFADQVVNQNPIQIQSFSLSQPTIQEDNGAAWSLFQVVARGGGYIVVNDLLPYDHALNPEQVSATPTLDYKTTFRITALDLDFSSNTLRVTVDTEDTRLDTSLLEADIIRSESIFRDAPISIDPISLLPGRGGTATPDPIWPGDPGPGSADPVTLL